MFGEFHSSSAGRYPSTREASGVSTFSAASNTVTPSNRPYGAFGSADGVPDHVWAPGLARSSRPRIFTSQECGYPPYGLVSTLAHHMCSWPLLKVQVDLQAIVQLWQAMHRLILNTNANWRSGYFPSY